MCDVGKCRRPNALIYAAFGEGRNKEVEVCEYHWEKHCDDNDKFDLHEYFYPTKRKSGEDKASKGCKKDPNEV